MIKLPAMRVTSASERRKLCCATNVSARGHLAAVKIANPTPWQPIQPTTMSKPFFALVVCAILVMVPSAHSTADSEVRPSLAFTVTVPILPHFRLVECNRVVVPHPAAGAIAVPASCRPDRFVN